ncbi:MAG: type II toxin-antitoxin system VapC family toxin [Gammaproteobacteria bacterium]
MSELLLDTHVWLWLMEGRSSLTKKVVSLIEKAHVNGSIFVSAISCWGIGMLESKKRIVLSMPASEWIKSAVSTGVEVLPLTPEVLLESCHLPGEFHADPADRMIVATARMKNITLVTRDKNILKYGTKDFVSTLRA